jgi:hypothetical protein
MAAESNLFTIFGNSCLVAGRNFCFFRQKAGYHFQRLGNWNWLIKQTKERKLCH